MKANFRAYINKFCAFIIYNDIQRLLFKRKSEATVRRIEEQLTPNCSINAYFTVTEYD